LKAGDLVKKKGFIEGGNVHGLRRWGGGVVKPDLAAGIVGGGGNSVGDEVWTLTGEVYYQNSKVRGMARSRFDTAVEVFVDFVFVLYLSAEIALLSSVSYVQYLNFNLFVEFQK
jgi:hypothetical protein